MTSKFYQNRVYPVLYMAAVAAVLVTGVSAIDVLTRERVEANRQWLTNRALLRVAGLAPEEDVSIDEANRLVEEHMHPLLQDERRPEQRRLPEVPVGAMDIWHVTAVETGESKGYVFSVRGMGYWDLVVGYAFVETDKTTLRGIVFVEHSETPGLGGEITNPDFTKQFEGVQIDQPLSIVPPDRVEPPNAIEAITGATRTSDAVAVFLNEQFKLFRNTIDEVAP